MQIQTNTTQPSTNQTTDGLSIRAVFANAISSLDHMRTTFAQGLRVAREFDHIASFSDAELAQRGLRRDRLAKQAFEQILKA